MDENKLRVWLKDSELKMPFPDFEDQMISMIRKEEKNRVRIHRNIRLSWLFFTIGALFGIAATTLLPLIKQTFFDLDMQLFQYPLLLLVIGVLLWQMEGVLRLTFKKKIQDL